MSDQTVDHKVIKTIRGHGRGWVLTPKHLASLGSRDAVASALKRYKQAGVITTLARGLYYYPRTDPDLGELEPSNDQIARALAGRDAVRLQPAGAYAANLLGLSSQVPTTIVYLTEGRSREVVVGSRRIVLKKTTPRSMATAGRISGLVIQALRHMGKDQVTAETVSRISDRISKADRRRLRKDIPYAPAWIAEIMRKLSAGEDSDDGAGGGGDRVDTGTISDTRRATPSLTARPHRRFFGTVSLDPQRASTQMGTILEEVLSHLSATGAHVKVSLDIEAHLDSGFPDHVRRVVGQNAADLRFEQAGFEEE